MIKTDILLISRQDNYDVGKGKLESFLQMQSINWMSEILQQ